MQNTIKDCIFDTIIESTLNAENMLVKISTTEGNVKRLPAADLPLQLRQVDPNLKNTALYVFTPKDSVYEILVGDNFLGIKAKQYNSWEDFFNFIKKTYDPLLRQSVIVNIKRIGLRYIDFICDPQTPIKHIKDFDKNDKILLQREFVSEDGIQCAVLLANQAKFYNEIGTVVDIITFKENINTDIKTFAEILHAKHKELFEEYTKNG